MIKILHFQSSRKSNTKNLLFPKVPCVVSLYTWIQENGCIIKETIPTPFRNYRPSAKGLHLIDTFSISTGEKPGGNLIPYTSGFCRTWTKRKHYFDTKNFREKIKLRQSVNQKPFLTKTIVLLFATFIENSYLWVLKIKR